MKTILLLSICLLSFIGFGQDEYSDEDDTLEFYAEYHILDYKKWTETFFEPSEENIEWDALSKMTYNPFINYDVLDSILRWRESKGYRPIKINLKSSDKRMKDNMSWFSMDVSKADSDLVTLARLEDEYPDCDCVNSITSTLLDDSTVWVDNKKETAFKTYLLTNRIKSIEIYYYQVSRRNDPNKKEEHLIVNIRRRFSIFTYPYEIY